MTVCGINGIYLAVLIMTAGCTAAGPGTQYVPVVGEAGKDGDSCSVAQVLPGDSILPLGGAIVQCNGSALPVLISNGAAGAAGTNGTNAPVQPYAIVGVIDPCGDATGLADEVFLRLANGALLWLQVDNGSALTARLALAVPGSFRTTDGSGCNFSINEQLEVTNEHY